MPYTAQFFSEKLNLPVDYFNPLRNVQFDPAVNLEELAKVAHCFGEVVGLGLRNLAHCPIELNLMPKSSVKQQQWRQKQPYIIASVFCLILVLFAFGWFYDKVASVKAKALENLNATVIPLKSSEQSMRNEMDHLRGAERELEQYAGWVEDRFYWRNVLEKLRESFIAVEAEQEKALKTPGREVKTGVWIERFFPVAPGGTAFAGVAPVTAVSVPAEPNPPGGPGGGGPPRRRRGGGPGPGGGPGGGGSPGTGSEISHLILSCKGVDLTAVAPAANNQIAYAVEQALKKQPDLFDPAGTALSGTLGVDEGKYTFTFEVTVKLKRPLKL
jgi:hypothetical protein